MDTLTTIILALITGIFGKYAWDYWKEKAKLKTQITLSGNAEATNARKELQEVLQSQIDHLKEHVDKKNGVITGLQQKNQSLEVRVMMLEERMIRKHTLKSREKKHK